MADVIGPFFFTLLCFFSITVLFLFIEQFFHLRISYLFSKLFKVKYAKTTFKWVVMLYYMVIRVKFNFFGIFHTMQTKIISSYEELTELSNNVSNNTIAI